MSLVKAEAHRARWLAEAYSRKSPWQRMAVLLAGPFANFLFASPPGMDGRAYYQKLKARGVLVRFLSQPTLAGYVRISVGSAEEMDALLAATKAILKEANA